MYHSPALKAVVGLENAAGRARWTKRMQIQDQERRTKLCQIVGTCR
jgi:hypothetical protein